MESSGFGVTPKELKTLVFEYVTINNIPNTFNKEKGTAGKDYLYGFMKRNPNLSLRKPEAIS